MSCKVLKCKNYIPKSPVYCEKCEEANENTSGDPYKDDLKVKDVREAVKKLKETIEDVNEDIEKDLKQLIDEIFGSKLI